MLQHSRSHRFEGLDLRFQRRRLPALLLVLLAGLACLTATAQTRLNDRDLEHMMKNVQQDAQPFRKAFDSSLRKSTIRGTSQEKDAKDLAETLEKQSRAALETFQKKQKAGPQVSALVQTAGQIDRVVSTVSLSPSVTAQWERLRTEIRQVADAYQVPMM